MSLVVAIDARLVGGTSTGDSTYWSGLLEGLEKIEPDARFLLFSDRPAQASFSPSSQFTWHTIPSRSGRWWSLVTLPLAVRRLKADVLHVQYSLSPLAPRRSITTVHDVSFLIGPEWFPTRDRILLARTVPAACRRASRVITVSKTSRSEIERLIPASVGKVRETALACPSWIQKVPRVDAQRIIEDRLRIVGPYMLTVGTRWPRKNMGLAIEASRLLPPTIPHKMVVTGKTGWGENELGPRGIATGYVDNYLLSCLYSAADLYLAPSRHEGFGIPVLEAFHCRCPVLCSSGGSLPEVAGDAAIVMNSWEPSAWAKAIEDALGANASEGGSKGDPGTLDVLRERGSARERKFSWETTAQLTLDVYREVAID